MSELANCPFCNGAGYVKYIGNATIGFSQSEVGCSECRFKRIQKFFRYKHDIEWVKQVTIAAWNRRAEPPSIDIDKPTKTGETYMLACEYYPDACRKWPGECENCEAQENVDKGERV